jgi:predicted DsbA family dithiol-disulfide isomerase
MSETFPKIVTSDNRHAPIAALHVEVIADLVCPFCYLGKRRLEQALDAVQGPTDISWFPYQLNPDMPDEGLTLDEYLSLRFGNPATIKPALDQLTAEGREVGIDLRFDRIERVPNTLSVHQVMYLAERERVDQTALAEELLKAFFERGENIGDLEILSELAGRHGLDAKAVARVIEDDTARQVVQSREAQVRASGIGGVPGFLLNRRLLVIGAQEKDALVSAFDRAMFGEGNDAIVSPALH